jgi:Carbamoyl-phosphate synthase small chain, CPSase domain
MQASTIPPHETTQKAILVLEDGTVFWGKGLGAFGQTLGEVCFNTSASVYEYTLQWQGRRSHIAARLSIRCQRCTT